MSKPKPTPSGSTFETRRWHRMLAWGLKSYPCPNTDIIKHTIAVLFFLDEMCRRDPRFRRTLTFLVRSWLELPLPK